MPDTSNKQRRTLLELPFWNQANLAWFGYAVLFFAMPWSLFMLTMSMIYLTAVTFVRGPGDGPAFKWKLRLPWYGLKRSFWALPDYWPLTLLFWMPLLNGVVTEDWKEWGNILRIHMAFLVLPWVFFCLPALSASAFRRLVYWIISMAFISAAAISSYYFLHFEAVQKALARGQSMPMPVSHIRYSLFVAMSILSAIWMLMQYPGAFSKTQKITWTIVIALLTGFMFLLAVRSGLIALLIGLLVLGISYAWRRKSYMIAMAIVAGLFLLPLGAYYTLPSFYQRVHYAMYDFNEMRKGTTLDASDSDRWTSWKYGWELFKREPLTGVGLADLRHEINLLHERDFGQAENVKLPHNQFLFYMAGAGIPGVLLFCLAFAWPFLCRRFYRDSYAIAFLLVSLSSFMVEYTLETSLGTAFFLGFWALVFKRSEPEIVAAR